MRKKVLLYTEKGSSDPNIELFQNDFFYRDFESIAIVSISGGGQIGIDSIPREFLTQFPIVLLDVEDSKRTIEHLMRLGVPQKNLIIWSTEGHLRPTFITDPKTGETIIAAEGLEFHCNNEQEIVQANMEFEYIRRNKYFFKVPPTQYRERMSKLFFERMKTQMNWENPQTFQEKLQWIFLNDVTPLKTLCSDKLRLREYVAQTIGAEHVVPVIDFWEDPDEIDFDSLPEKFVIKCNHGWGMNILVRDRKNFNPRAIREKLHAWLMLDSYIAGCCFDFHNIHRRVFAEPFLEVRGEEDVPTYDVACFNGEPRFIATTSPIGWKLDFFDLNWKYLDLTHPSGNRSEDPRMIRKPENLSLMIELARKLSRNFIYTNVDFYEVDGKLLVSEMDFTRYSGGSFCPIEYDKIFGSMLKLPIEHKPFDPFEKIPEA